MAGVRHRLVGRRGEDAFAWAVSPDLVLAAVADGVSATPRAATAAGVAVAAACAVLGPAEAPGVGESAPPEPSPGLCAAAMDAANEAVAQAVGGVLDGATTLVLAVVGIEGRWEASRVGDSEALILGPAGWRSVFGDPVFGDSGAEELRSGATDALPGPGTVRQDAAGDLGADEVLVLVTDGVAGPLRDGPSTVARGLAEGLQPVPSPLELAALIDFARQGCHDDRTLLALWPLSAGPAELRHPQ